MGLIARARVRAAVLLALGTAYIAIEVSAAAGAPETVVEVEAYRGKYSAEAWCRALVEAMPGYVSESLSVVEARLGIIPDPAVTIQILLRDAHPQTLKAISPSRRPPFRTFHYPGGRVHILLNMEFFADMRHDPRQIVLHELVHAVMRTHLKEEDYTKIPHWVREGLAVWTAEQTDERIRTVIRESVRRGSLDRVVPGLEAGDHGLGRYAEYALAMERLVERSGNDAIKKLAQELCAGESCQSVVSELSGERYARFLRESNAFARTRVATKIPRMIDAYAAIVRADKARKYSDVERRAGRFLRQHAKSWLAPNVMYFRAKAARLRKKPARAAKLLDALLDRGPEDNDYFDEALYQLGAVRLEADQPARALESARRLLRDHPDSPLLDRALYHQIAALVARGMDDEALAAIKLYERSFANGKDRRKVAALKRRVGS